MEEPKPKFQVGDWVTHKYNHCLYRVGAYRFIKEEYNSQGFWYALHGYDYLVQENLLEKYNKIIL
jgi:hypothetical protein